jgi:hypothetical protein
VMLLCPLVSASSVCSGSAICYAPVLSNGWLVWHSTMWLRLHVHLGSGFLVRLVVISMLESHEVHTYQ